MGNQEKNPYLKIQDWAKADRPREKLMQRGCSVLTDAELIGILIGSGTNRMSAVNLAQLILNHYNNDLNLLAKCSVKELQNFKGIGEAKAIAIVSAMELGRRRTTNSMAPRPRLHNSHSVYHAIKAALLDKPIEEFWILLINQAHYLIKKQLISIGGLTTTLADPKVVFKAALEYQAAGIILAHNHPSGNPNPSEKDIVLTKKLIDGGKLLDIAVQDHIIVAGSKYYSFVDEKLLFGASSIATPGK